MLKFTMLLLCLILAGAAAGRYKAEAAVREMRSELRQLESAKADEFSKVQVLRAEVAYLESPERLSTIAAKLTNLAPLTGAQLLTAEDFQLAFGDGEPQANATESATEPSLEVAQIDPLPLR